MIHSSRHNSNQGVSEVIGFVLLIGLAVVMSVFVVAAAEGGPISALEEQSTNEQVKNTFSQISSSSVGAAVGGQGTSETVNTPFANPSNPIKVSEQGTISVTSFEDESDTTGSLIFKKNMGYLEYTATNSNKSIYFQNGAVWRIYDNGAVQTVTAPEFHYKGETLTLPIIQIDAKANEISEQVTFNHKDTSRSTEQLATDDTILEITIEGPVYMGWGSYFESRFGKSVVEYNHDANSVTVTLGTAPTTYNTIGNEVAILEGTMSTGNNSTVTGDVIENAGQELPSADDAIQDQKDYAQSSGTTLSTVSGKTLTAGDYYIDDVNLGEDETLTVDVSSGDVNLSVDQSIFMDSDSQIRVVNTEGNDYQFTTYLDEDITMQPHSEWTVDSTNKGQNIVYASSTSTFNPHPHSTFQGVYYAPGGGGSGGGNSGPPDSGGSGNCGPETSLCMQPHSTIQGAVITDSADLSPHATLNFDDSLTNLQLDSTTSDDDVRPDLSYFHTSTTVVEVDDKDD